MARYINVDKLSKEVIAFWDKDNHHTIEASRVHRQEHHHLMSIIEKQPIADVVPKSEVEELQTEIEELQAKVARLRKENIELLVSKETDIHISMEKLLKVRTEHPIFKAIEEKVAREIFEEIEKKSSSCVAVQNGYEHYETKTYTISALKLDEIKKKYTENME